MTSKARKQLVKFDCLLPTGLLLQVSVTGGSSFEDVKREVWKAAAKMPLFNVLKDRESYGFRFVNLEAEVQVVDDDEVVMKTQPRMYQPILKIFHRKGSKVEQKQNIEIGSLIGKHLNDFESMRDPEVNAFRRDILTSICQKVVEERDKGDTESQLMYRYPPNVESTPLPRHLKEKLPDNKFLVKIRIKKDKKHSKEFTLKADLEGTPRDLVIQTLKKNNNQAHADDYMLQFAGRDEYLLGNDKLGSYKRIRIALASTGENQTLSDIRTNLVLVTRKEILNTLPKLDPEVARALMKRAPQIEEGISSVRSESLWYGRHAEKNFSFKISEARNVVTGKLFGVGVLAGIYLGDVEVCQPQRTRYIPPCENPVWTSNLIFEDLAIKDIPRNARICLSLHGVWVNPLKLKKKKTMRNEFPLAWVNMTVFDFKRALRTGKLVLATWQYPDTESDLANPLGTTVANPDRNMSPLLTIEFEEYPTPVVFPDKNQHVIGQRTEGKVDPTPAGLTALELKEIEPVLYADPLHQFSEREIQLLREYKWYHKHIPVALSKTLRAIDWNTNEATHEVADILRLWAKLPAELAIELLDASFADEAIRNYAVSCMEEMGDDQLLAYLMQLVQVLKYESYLDCELARFLLRRALRNQVIGHYFFWYLKSEMHFPEVSVRYGLLLEAYCRGCGTHMHDLGLQNEAMRKITRIAEQIKDKAIKDKKGYSQTNLEKAHIGEFQLPIDPGVKLNGVKCRKVFDSAQKPMWLVFKNSNADGKDVNVMFKCGDDLRQDMLTLQLIRVMDQKWQEHGLYLQMIPYECLSTGDEIGFLEMVMNSATIANIQGGVKNVLWAEDTLTKWLRGKNKGTDAYDKACDNFLHSCAGYCVATYVLGVADRHNDNIMITEDGKLFHIDFGHFLANWKSKFGVRRERVKFILVPEFVHVLTKGVGTKSERWAQFKEVCKQAYLIVRKHANLFINLLNMMLSTGIPELRSHEDVKYLRETLCLDISDDNQAADNFMDEIDVALKDSKMVKVNWAFHSAKH